MITLSVSIMLIASTVANCVSGVIAEKVGRKLTLVGANLVLVTSWVITYFAPNFLTLLAGRVIMGLGCGVALSTSYMLIGEISLITYRGSIGNINTTCLNCGYMFTLIIGTTLPLPFYAPCKSE